MLSAKGKKSFATSSNGTLLRPHQQTRQFIRFLKEYDINQTSGNQLAQEIGAIKYVQLNSKSGRGANILINEIAYAGLGKVKELKRCVTVESILTFLHYLLFLICKKVILKYFLGFVVCFFNCNNKQLCLVL